MAGKDANNFDAKGKKKEGKKKEVNGGREERSEKRDQPWSFL
ncbi:hypothetical protein OROMI_015063 [Orobanche minor]